MHLYCDCDIHCASRIDWNPIGQLTESDNQSVQVINIDSSDFNERETRNSLTRIIISTQLPSEALLLARSHSIMTLSYHVFYSGDLEL